MKKPDKMPCPVCGWNETQIQHQQVKPDCIKRRRMCMNCGYVFNTSEEIKK